MDFDKSLQLFSKHAFRRDHPPPEKLDQSREIVKIAQGLPLVLEVMGSTLSWCGQREDIWDEYLEKWKMGLIEEIRSKLMISYKALDICQRQIFLDIACLFIGRDKNDAIYMWKDCGFYPAQGLEVLQLMSLIKIEEHNKFWMHDHFKDLGREIVSRENQDNLAKNSRLWNHDEALNVLQRKQRNENVEALCMQFVDFREYRLSLEGFAALPNLRFLQVDSNCLNSDLIERFLSEATLLWHNRSSIFSPMNILKRKKQLLPNLRWLMWHNFPLRALKITYFAMSNLVILDISYSKITHDWDGWRHIKRVCKLKVLNLTSCTRLTKTPDLSELLTLERLILDGCYRLAKIDSSIGELKNLIFLSLIGCKELQYLPEELGGLPSLTQLFLDRTSIQEFPEWWALKELENPSVHDYSSVKTSGSINLPASSSKLSLAGIPITHLPDSIGALPSLKRLSMSLCNHLNELPYSIGRFPSLTELHLVETGITELPDSMKSLENLKILTVWNWLESRSIFALPILPGSLTSLAIMSMSLITIPDFSNLINLKELILLMGPPKLSSPSESVRVPMPWWLGRLAKLQSLALMIPRITKLSPEVGALSHLEFLCLLDCKSLRRIPQIPSSVSKLHISGCCSLTTLDISNLKNLSELYIVDTPVEDLSRRELLDNLLKSKMEKIEIPGVKHSLRRNLFEMVLSWRRFPII